MVSKYGHGERSWKQLETTGATVRTDVSGGRRDGPVIVSYAQNAEDVRLWRIFSGKRDWCVRRRRGRSSRALTRSPICSTKRDGRTQHRAGPGVRGARRGAAARHQPRGCDRRPRWRGDLWVSSPDPVFPASNCRSGDLVPEGFTSRRSVSAAPAWTAVIEQHLAGQPIDFMKIDVEGAEREVLSSFHPEIIRPTVILVEAISAAPQPAEPRRLGIPPHRLRLRIRGLRRDQSVLRSQSSAWISSTPLRTRCRFSIDTRLWSFHSAFRSKLSKRERLSRTAECVARRGRRRRCTRTEVQRERSG